MSVNIEGFKKALIECIKIYNLVKLNTSNEFTEFNIKP